MSPLYEFFGFSDFSPMSDMWWFLQQVTLTLPLEAPNKIIRQNIRAPLLILDVSD